MFLDTVGRSVRDNGVAGVPEFLSPGAYASAIQ